MIDLSIYNQSAPPLDETYLTSEIYPVLTSDTFSASGQVNESINGFFLSSLKDTFDVAASMQGNHDLVVIRVDHDLYDTDIFDVSASMQGNHSLALVRVDHDLYDTDIFDVAASMQGNHTLLVVRVDHDLYDTDTFDVAASMQGNHTLS